MYRPRGEFIFRKLRGTLSFHNNRTTTKGKVCLGPGTTIQVSGKLFCRQIGPPICWDSLADLGGGVVMLNRACMFPYHVSIPWKQLVVLCSPVLSLQVPSVKVDFSCHSDTNACHRHSCLVPPSQQGWPAVGNRPSFLTLWTRVPARWIQGCLGSSALPPPPLV